MKALLSHRTKMTTDSSLALNSTYLATGSSNTNYIAKSACANLWSCSC